jgi:hypothetical protein
MRRFLVVLALLTQAPSARAGEPVAAPSAAPAPPPAPTAAGLAVVALPGATDAAWPLAAAVYANAGLRPATLDDAAARILCGEAAPAGSPPALKDLADSVAALRGDDAPSRAILDALARRFSVRAMVVVQQGPGQASAQTYLPETGAFDPARYTPETGPAPWASVAQSLARVYAPAPPAAPPPSTAAPVTPPSPASAAPALATHPVPPAPAHPAPRAFWTNGWFWGAIGAAAFAGGAAYFITRDNTASTIHLEMQVPH